MKNTDWKVWASLAVAALAAVVEVARRKTA